MSQNFPNSRIIATAATMPARLGKLLKSLPSILSQVDEVRLYLNGHKSIPTLLAHPKIKLYSSEWLGDRHAEGKFYEADTLDGYHFTFDDDIIYPKDYVSRLIAAIEHYERRFIVGVHGVIFKSGMQNYWKDRVLFYGESALEVDTPVHLLGTGTMAYHTSTVKIKPTIFKLKNTVDLQLAIEAQRQKIGMVAVSRPDRWLDFLPVEQESIYVQNLARGEELTALANTYPAWELHASTSFAQGIHLSDSVETTVEGL